MALISDSAGRPTGSGYARVFGDNRLGELISRVHATSIRCGTELEQMVKQRVTLIDDLDDFLLMEIMPEGVFVADKRELKACRTLDFAGSEPDFLVFKRRRGQQACHVIELKDGDSFDTKKASAERNSMHSFISYNASRLPYIVHAYFCCFNQTDRSAIHDGFKRKLAIEEAMTGREFCDLLEIDYDEIRTERAQDGPANLSFFVAALQAIPAVREELAKYGLGKSGI